MILPLNMARAQRRPFQMVLPVESLPDPLQALHSVLKAVEESIHIPVSYTQLDVYKRQDNAAEFVALSIQNTPAAQDTRYGVWFEPLLPRLCPAS